MRSHGADGIVKCKYETFIPASHGTGKLASPYEDFLPAKGTIVLGHQELEQELEIEIVEKDDDGEIDRDDLFGIKLFEPEGGAKISKKDTCYVNIVGDSEVLEKIQGIEKML